MSGNFEKNNTNNEIMEKPISEKKKKTFLGVSGPLGVVLEWAILLIVAFAVAMVIRNHVFIVVRVYGPSMDYTLAENDWLYVHRFMYTPQRGHIVIFEPPIQDPNKSVFIKRVIAVEGDSIYIDSNSGNVYLNGELKDEPYIRGTTHSGTFMQDMHVSRDNPFVVPDGYIFVMGDNRPRSQDSRNREVGPISTDAVMGRAVFRLWPFRNFGTLQ